MIDILKISTVINEIKTLKRNTKVQYIQYYETFKNIPLTKLTLKIENGNVFIEDIEAQQE